VAVVGADGHADFVEVPDRHHPVGVSHART
jgi:hypothetical protein